MLIYIEPSVFLLALKEGMTPIRSNHIVGMSVCVDVREQSINSVRWRDNSQVWVKG